MKKLLQKSQTREENLVRRLPSFAVEISMLPTIGSPLHEWFWLEIIKFTLLLSTNVDFN